MLSRHGVTRHAAHTNTVMDIMVEIQTASMEPALPVGNIVAVERRQPSVGEVAAFLTTTGDVMVHRILARWETPLGVHYVHRGDAARRTGLLLEHQIVGVVRGPVPRLPDGLTVLRLWYMGMLAGVAGHWFKFYRAHATRGEVPSASQIAETAAAEGSLR